MAKFAWGLGLLPILAIAASVPAQDGAPSERAAALVRQLGSQRFAEREQAARALEALGAPAVAALRAGLKADRLEVRRRCADLLRRLERRAEAARLLAPAKLRLVYKDTPIPDAVADLAKRSGLKLTLGGDLAALARRRLTLDTGETPFWEAFDRFCRQAGLCEVDLPPSPPVPAQGGGTSVMIMGRRNGPPTVDVLGRPPSAEPLTLVLRDGSARLPASLTGPVRVRALPPSGGAPDNPGEAVLHLDVTAGPALSCREVAGVKLTRAVDDQGQHLTGRFVAPTPDPAAAAARGVVIINGRVVTPPDDRPAGPARHVPLRFASAARPAKTLKELSGTLLARVESPPEILAEVPDILKAAGKKVAGPKGIWLQVHEVRRADDGDVTLRVEVAPAPQGLSDGSAGSEPLLNVFVNGRRVGEPQDLLSERNFGLFDAAGRPLPATAAAHTGKRTATTHEYELTFRRDPTAGQGGEAFRFVYRDRRSAVLEIPFTLNDVPLR